MYLPSCSFQSYLIIHLNTLEAKAYVTCQKQAANGVVADQRHPPREVRARDRGAMCILPSDGLAWFTANIYYAHIGCRKPNRKLRY